MITKQSHQGKIFQPREQYPTGREPLKRDGRTHFAQRMKLLKNLADATMRAITTDPTFELFDDREPVLDRFRSNGGYTPLD